LTRLLGFATDSEHFITTRLSPIIISTTIAPNLAVNLLKPAIGHETKKPECWI
jgi:hypothetical protein